MTARPTPRLVVEERGPSAVALVMRFGLTTTHDRELGRLPAKLRPVFDAAVILSASGSPSERWEEVVAAGISLVARDPRFRHLLEARKARSDTGPDSQSEQGKPAPVTGSVVESEANKGEPRSVESADGARSPEGVGSR